jgi:hypothetical protein
MLFDFGCSSLAQEMIFVDCYLTYFRQWLITCLLLALLPFQPLFTESLCGDQLLALGCFQQLCSSAVCYFSVSYLLFRSFFLGGRVVSLPRGLCLFIPGVAGGILLYVWCSLVWSAKCLPSRFGASIWRCRSPPVFSV